MLKLPKIEKKSEGNISEVKKIKRVLVSVAMAVGITAMSLPVDAAHVPTVPAAIQQTQQTKTHGSLLLMQPSNNPLTVAQHYSHRSHSSHSSHRSHYSSRY